jgi:hypothetical protein
MQIGPITLNDFEVPQSVTFGGRYRLAVHKSAYGTRVIENLGPDESDIQFQGIFSGPQAEDRARALNEVRLSGNPIWLSWNSFKYRVIISRLSLTYRNPSWILYKSTCVIIHQPGAAALQAQSTQAQIAADFQSAQTMTAMLGIDITQVVPQLSTQSLFSPGSAAFDAAQNQLSSASTQIAAAMVGPSNSVSDSGVLSGSAISATEFANTMTDAEILCYGCLSNAYVGRIQRLL